MKMVLFILHGLKLGVSIGIVWSVWGWGVQLWISDQPQIVGCPAGLSDQSEVVGCPVVLSDQSEVVGCLLWMSDQSDVAVCPSGLLISLRLCCVRWDCLISRRLKGTGTAWSVREWGCPLWISDQFKCIEFPLRLFDQSEVVGCPLRLSVQSEGGGVHCEYLISRRL